jgi:hypothetical protein
MKCSSTGRTCDGYNALPPGRAGVSRPLLPASRSPSTNGNDASSGSSSSRTLIIGLCRSCSVTFSPPPSTLAFSITDSERSAFEFFYTRMAGPLEIMSPAKGWIQQALQVSSGSKAVFHAIAALSSANLAMASIQHPTFAGLSKPERYTEALNQYSKTIAALHRQIRDVVDGKAHLEPVLLTCLLLVCYELHAERSSMAIRHHTMGHDIVKKHLGNGIQGSPSSSGSSSSLQQLADSFARLGVGSNYPGSDHAFPARGEETTQQSIVPLGEPLKLGLMEIWDELDKLIDTGKELLSKLYQLTAQRVKAIYGESLEQIHRAAS